MAFTFAGGTVSHDTIYELVMGRDGTWHYLHPEVLQMRFTSDLRQVTPSDIRSAMRAAAPVVKFDGVVI